MTAVLARARDLLLLERRRWLLPVAMAVVLVFTVVLAAQSYFYADDLFFPAYFRENPIDADLLTRSWFGHLMPAYAASLVAFFAVFGMSWPAAAVIIGLIHTGVFTAVVRIVDAVVGSRLLGLLIGIATALSLGPIALRLWWAASLNNTFALAISLAALGCLTRFVVHRRYTGLVAGLLLYALALASSEKSLLFSMHIFFWCVLVVWRGLPVLERLKKLLRTWPVWVGIVVLSVIEIYLYLNGPYLEESGDSPSTATTLEFMANGIFGGFLPSFFGFDLLRDAPALLSPVVIVCTVLVAAFVIVSIVLVRSNGGVWIYALIAVLANTFVLTRRADIIGVDAGRELRYHLENTALVWIAIGVVLFSILNRARDRERAREATEGASRGPSRGTGRRIVVGVGAAAGVLLLAGSTVVWAQSFSAILKSSKGQFAQAWVEAMSATVPEDPPPLIDAPLPDGIALPALWPYNMTSSILPLYGTDARFTDSLDGAWVVGSDGVAGPAELVRTELVPRSTTCSIDASDIRLPRAEAAPGRFIAIDYSRSEAGSLAVFAGDRWHVIDRPAGSGTLVLHLPDGVAAGELKLSPQGVPICVDSVRFGDVVVRSASALDQ